VTACAVVSSTFLQDGWVQRVTAWSKVGAPLVIAAGKDWSAGHITQDSGIRALRIATTADAP